jgi:hypothetical protein
VHLLLTCLLAPAHAVDRYVGPDDAHPTLADALAVAADGDVLYLRPGLHAGGDSVAVDVTIIGLGGVPGTVLRGGGDAVLTVESGTALTVEGLSIDGAGLGRGIDVRPRGSLFAERVAISDCAAPDGAGLRVEGGTATLLDVVLVANHAAGAGGGAQVLGGGDLVVDDGRWAGNTAVRGGGLAVDDGVASLVSVAMDHNTATADGGAVWSVGTVELLASSLCGNMADGLGGGVAVLGGAAALRAVALLDSVGGAVHSEGIATLRNLSVLGTVGDGVSSSGEVTLDDSLVAWTDGTGTVNVATSYTLFYANSLHYDGRAGDADLYDMDPLLAAYTPDGLCADVLLPGRDSPLVDAGTPSARDRDGTVADIGATGGATALALHWEDGDGDGAPWLMDCNDAVPDRSPALAEVVADGIDQDCDTRDACWRDADGDGYGGDVAVQVAGASCELHAGVALVGGDCDDRDPGASPGRREVCGGGDDDCDGLTDDADPSLDPLSVSTWYRDGDGDGYGDPEDALASCAPPDGYTADPGDCDDLDPSVSPAGIELVGDGVDQDCDGSETCYTDADGDGYGVPELVLSDDLRCEAAGVADRTGDCADDDAARNPATREVCSGVDDDCDGLTDDADDSVLADTWYSDGDGDGDGDASRSAAWCLPPTGWVATATDCDDRDPRVEGLDADGDGITTCDGDCDDADVGTYPDAPEFCDGLDQDCDGAPDDGFTLTTWWADADGDGFGDADAPQEACAAPPAHVDDATDCDDTAPTTFPGAPPVVADGVDQDCDGAEECWMDADGDGVGSDVVQPGSGGCRGAGESAETGDCDDADPDRAPGLPEVPDDGIDQDCDGTDAFGVDPTSPEPTGDTGTSGKPGDAPAGWFCSAAGGAGGWVWLAAPLWFGRRRRVAPRQSSSR